MRLNSYVIVFAIIGVVVAAAAASTLLSQNGQTENNTSLPNLGKAPNFQGIVGWINSPPLDLSQLKGKVVLVDFWTYSCINCIRTIPYLNAWYSEYGHNGLEIIGVHTPEFEFEKNYSNVLAATKSFGVSYPIALDSNYATWNAYNNKYWPADYLIDKDGTLRAVHFGEGDYNATETEFRELLKDAGYSLGPVSLVNGAGVNFAGIGTPELYVGYATARTPIGNVQGFSPGQVVDYVIQGSMQRNTVYFSGRWYNANDSMIAFGIDSKVYLIYEARAVNIVGRGNSSVITVKLDGNSLSQSYLGSDLALSGGVASADISMARLYNIVNAPSYGWHELEIDAGTGFALYTFTFG